mmetsp:Transcript_50951/g.111029  ORF Transcript_50951/g.111029 Transcript_50951/m.111029 type:complete len:241 (-) Transcript_50951:331-1053(-)
MSQDRFEFSSSHATRSLVASSTVPIPRSLSWSSRSSPVSFAFFSAACHAASPSDVAMIALMSSTRFARASQPLADFRPFSHPTLAACSVSGATKSLGPVTSGGVEISASFLSRNIRRLRQVWRASGAFASSSGAKLTIGASFAFFAGVAASECWKYSWAFAAAVNIRLLGPRASHILTRSASVNSTCACCWRQGGSARPLAWAPRLGLRPPAADLGSAPLRFSLLLEAFTASVGCSEKGS